MRIVAALGGNALLKRGEPMTAASQRANVKIAARALAPLIHDGHQLIITHGNGPQVGFILRRSELAKDILHEVPLDYCGADTQGAIGYMFQKSLHNEFHTIYGDNSTIEDFQDFLRGYEGNTLNLNYCTSFNMEKYFPYKKNSSSKYKYVIYLKNQNKWQVRIPIGKKQRFQNIGRFNCEYEAAEACNKKLIELNGENVTINKLDEKDKSLDYGDKKKFHKNKENSSSIYFGVNKVGNSNRWLARIRYGNKRINLGVSETEWIAAELYNQKAFELFKDDAVINKLSDEHIQEKLVLSKSQYFQSL